MDPIVRAVKDVRGLKRNVGNPFDAEKLAEYFCTTGRDMGFTTIKNYRRNGAKVLCAWLDGKTPVLSMNAEFGNMREILGAVAEMLATESSVCVLVTASNPIKPLDSVLEAIDVIVRGTTVVVLDVNRERGYVVEG